MGFRYLKEDWERKLEEKQREIDELKLKVADRGEVGNEVQEDAETSGKLSPEQVRELAKLVAEARGLRVEKGGGGRKVDVAWLVSEVGKMIEEGASVADILATYSDVGFNTLKAAIKAYRELKKEERAIAGVESRYLEAMYMVARTFGEEIRDNCPYYNDEAGVCTLWRLTDVEKGVKRRWPGLLRAHGGAQRFRVLDHPWVCAFCRRGRG